ncbi:MAG TPA: hypothetical protein VKZ63_15845 [Kofleriaceae bacterium]|nr:hypothetical protein [Kofleriaceae bacterium]
MGGARVLVLCLIAACGSDSGGANPDGGPGPADGSPSGGDGGGGGGGGLVASGITPRIIGVDDRHVYWSHWLGGGLFRAPQEGGAVEILIPDGEKTSDGVVAAGGLLYVHTSCETSIGGICRMPAEGGPLELVHHGGNGQGLTVIDGAVYWASYDGAHGVDEAGEAVDLSPYDSDLTQFGVVGEHLYIRELDGIARVEIGPDAEPPVWFASAPNPLGLKSDGEYLYWFDIVAAEGGGPLTTIRRKRLDSAVAASAEEAEPGEPLLSLERVLAPFAFEVADEGVYFVFFQSTSGTPGGRGSLARIPREGGEMTVLAPDQPGPQDIALTAEHVFVSSLGTCTDQPDCSGRIVRVPR